jgi:hypothetical protein
VRLPTIPPEFLCHLPFLRMEAGSAQALAQKGRLEPLPYEEWLLLEDPAMDYHERRYRNVAPVFVRAELPKAATPGELDKAQERAIDDIIERSHTATLLALPGRPVTAPSLSTSYVVWRGLPCDAPDNQPSQPRRVSEHWSNPIDRETLADFDRWLNNHDRTRILIHVITDRIQNAVADSHLTRLLYHHPRNVRIRDRVHDLFFVRRSSGHPLTRLSRRFAGEDAVLISPFAQAEFRRRPPQWLSVVCQHVRCR